MLELDLLALPGHPALQQVHLKIGDLKLGRDLAQRRPATQAH